VNRRATFNAAAFHYDYRNQQFLDAFALPGGAGTGFHTVNAPKSRVDGAELNFARARRTTSNSCRARPSHQQVCGVDASRCRFVGQPPDPGAGLRYQRGRRLAVCASGCRRLQAAAGCEFLRQAIFRRPNTERIAQGSYGIANSRISFESESKPGFAVAPGSRT